VENGGMGTWVWITRGLFPSSTSLDRARFLLFPKSPHDVLFLPAFLLDVPSRGVPSEFQYSAYGFDAFLTAHHRYGLEATMIAQSYSFLRCSRAAPADASADRGVGFLAIACFGRDGWLGDGQPHSPFADALGCG